MNENAIVPPLAGFKDRRTGLLVFGILEIILGCLLALMVPLMVLGQLLAGQLPGAEPTPLRMLLPAVLMYVGMAAAFIWLGIGSVRCRRWARALLLIISWMWLVGGIAGTLAVGFILPQMFSGGMPGTPPGTPAMPAAARAVLTVIMLGFCAVFYVILPAVLVFFYRSPHVKATCEARDPVPRWTDACPLPVLAVSLILGLGAAMMPLMIVIYRCVIPCFGTYLNGAPAAVALLVLLVAYAYAARATYQLKVAGWWIAVLGFGVSVLSAAVTFARVGLLPMYELMDVPKAQIDMMRQMGFLNSPWLWVLILACWLPFWGFVVYTKKFFRR